MKELLPSIIALSVAIVGWRFIKINNKKDRRELVLNLYMRIYNDKEILKMFININHGNYKFDKEKFDKTEEVTAEEMNVDTILNIFDLLCKLKKEKVLLKEDLDIVNADMIMVYNSGIHDYLDYLKQQCYGMEKRNYFGYFSEYCEKLEVITKIK